MTEPGSTEQSPDDMHTLMSDALRHAIGTGTRDVAPLRTSVTEYVRSRRSLGLRPEEVVIELKAKIASTLQHHPAPMRGSHDVADVVAEQVVRLAIEAYFAD